MKKAIGTAEVTTSKVTHIGRKSGPSLCPDAEDNKTRRMGNWNTSAMDTCYLNDVPITTVLEMAGFEKNRNGYHLLRSSVEPPLELQQMVFPQLDRWLRIFKTGRIGFDYSLAE